MPRSSWSLLSTDSLGLRQPAATLLELASLESLGKKEQEPIKISTKNGNVNLFMVGNRRQNIIQLQVGIHTEYFLKGVASGDLP
jgi:hypothetical protein